MKQLLNKFIKFLSKIKAEKYMHSEVANTIAFGSTLLFLILGPVLALICSFIITSVCILVKDYYIDEEPDVADIIASYIGASKIWLILILFI